MDVSKVLGQPDIELPSGPPKFWEVCETEIDGDTVYQVTHIETREVLVNSPTRKGAEDVVSLIKGVGEFWGASWILYDIHTDMDSYDMDMLEV